MPGFFSWISFPKSPEYPMKAASNFFEHFRRYSQLKVHHRYHWHRGMANGKICNQKSFNYFAWTPMSCRFIIYVDKLFFKFTLSFKQSDIVPVICLQLHRWQNLPPVLLTPDTNLPSLVDIVGTPWLGNIFANFFSKFEMTLMLFSGVWGRRFMKQFCDTAKSTAQ